MPDLLRPEPPRSIADRVRSILSLVTLWRALAALGVVAIAVVAGWWLLRAPPPPVERSLPVAGRTASGSAAGSTTSPPTTVASGVLVVQAAGAVNRPGVYRVPAGSRVVDLLDAAGGVAGGADPQAINLAAKLVDGQRLYVPAKGEPVPAAAAVGAASASSAPPAEPLDLNTATVEQLDTLPGVGPATSAAIVARRERHGPFRSVEQLADVPGIGPSKLDAIRPLVHV